MARNVHRGILLVALLGVLAAHQTAIGQKKEQQLPRHQVQVRPELRAVRGRTRPSKSKCFPSADSMKFLLRLQLPSACMTPGKVVVLDLPSLQNIQAFDSFYANAEAIRTAFSTMTSASSAGGGIDDFADITSAVGAAATASTTETSSSFTITDPTAALMLLNHLGSETLPSCKGAYYGGVYAAENTRGVQINGKLVPPVLRELGLLSLSRGQALRTLIGKTAPPAHGRPPQPPDPTQPPQPDDTGSQEEPSNPGPTGGPFVADDSPQPQQGPPQSGGAPPPPTGPPQSGGVNPPVAVIPPVAPLNAGGPQSPQDPRLSAFNNLDGTYNTFLSGLSTPNATTGQPLLSSVLEGFRLRALMSTGSDASPIIAVYVNVAFAGGTQQDRKNLITAVITGDWIKYSGGLSVNVIIFQIAGTQTRSLFSDLLRYRTQLKRIKKPQGYKGAGSAA